MNNDNKNNSTNTNNPSNQNNPNNNSSNNAPIKEAEVVKKENKTENQNNNKVNPENSDSNRNIMRSIGIVLAVIIILVVFGILPKKNKTEQKDTNTPAGQELPEGCKPGYLFSETTGKPCPQPGEEKTEGNQDKTQEDKKNQSSDSETSSYDSALAQFSGKAILLGADCKAMPENVEVSAGTRVLVANHTDKDAKIAVADLRTENLENFHYFTVALKEKGEYKVSCNDNTVATFNVK